MIETAASILVTGASGFVGRHIVYQLSNGGYRVRASSHIHIGFALGGGWWTQGLLQQMQRGKVVLVDRGVGIANLIHVSDVGSIVPLVLRSAGLVSGIFNVTDAAPVEWSRYFAELEKLAGKSATVSMTAQQAREHGRKWIRPSLIHRAIRKLTGAPVIFPLDDQGIVNFTSRAVYSNHKAVELLGFAPEYDLETGMRTVRGLA